MNLKRLVLLSIITFTSTMSQMKFRPPRNSIQECTLTMNADDNARRIQNLCNNFCRQHAPVLRQNPYLNAIAFQSCHQNINQRRAVSPPKSLFHTIIHPPKSPDFRRYPNSRSLCKSSYNGKNNRNELSSFRSDDFFLSKFSRNKEHMHIHSKSNRKSHKSHFSRNTKVVTNRSSAKSGGSFQKAKTSLNILNKGYQKSLDATTTKVSSAFKKELASSGQLQSNKSRKSSLDNKTKGPSTCSKTLNTKVSSSSNDVTQKLLNNKIKESNKSESVPTSKVSNSYNIRKDSSQNFLYDKEKVCINISDEHQNKKAVIDEERTSNTSNNEQKESPQKSVNDEKKISNTLNNESNKKSQKSFSEQEKASNTSNYKANENSQKSMNDEEETSSTPKNESNENFRNSASDKEKPCNTSNSKANENSQTSVNDEEEVSNTSDNESNEKSQKSESYKEKISIASNNKLNEKFQKSDDQEKTSNSSNKEQNENSQKSVSEEKASSTSNNKSNENSQKSISDQKKTPSSLNKEQNENSQESLNHREKLFDSRNHARNESSPKYVKDRKNVSNISSNEPETLMTERLGKKETIIQEEIFSSELVSKKEKGDDDIQIIDVKSKGKKCFAGEVEATQIVDVIILDDELGENRTAQKSFQDKEKVTFNNKREGSHKSLNDKQEVSNSSDKVQIERFQKLIVENETEMSNNVQISINVISERSLKSLGDSVKDFNILENMSTSKKLNENLQNSFKVKTKDFNTFSNVTIEKSKNSVEAKSKDSNTSNNITNEKSKNALEVEAKDSNTCNNLINEECKKSVVSIDKRNRAKDLVVDATNLTSEINSVSYNKSAPVIAEEAFGTIVENSLTDGEKVNICKDNIIANKRSNIFEGRTSKTDLDISRKYQNCEQKEICNKPIISNSNFSELTSEISIKKNVERTKFIIQEASEDNKKEVTSMLKISSTEMEEKDVHIFDVKRKEVDVITLDDQLKESEKQVTPTNECLGVKSIEKINATFSASTEISKQDETSSSLAGTNKIFDTNSQDKLGSNTNKIIVQNEKSSLNSKYKNKTSTIGKPIGVVQFNPLRSMNRNHVELKTACNSLNNCSTLIQSKNQCSPNLILIGVSNSKQTHVPNSNFLQTSDLNQNHIDLYQNQPRRLIHTHNSNYYDSVLSPNMNNYFVQQNKTTYPHSQLESFTTDYREPDLNFSLSTNFHNDFSFRESRYQPTSFNLIAKHNSFSFEPSSFNRTWDPYFVSTVYNDYELPYPSPHYMNDRYCKFSQHPVHSNSSSHHQMNVTETDSSVSRQTCRVVFDPELHNTQTEKYSTESQSYSNVFSQSNKPVTQTNDLSNTRVDKIRIKFNEKCRKLIKFKVAKNNATSSSKLQNNNGQSPDSIKFDDTILEEKSKDVNGVTSVFEKIDADLKHLETLKKKTSLSLSKNIMKTLKVLQSQFQGVGLGDKFSPLVSKIKSEFFNSQFLEENLTHDKNLTLMRLNSSVQCLSNEVMCINDEVKTVPDEKNDDEILFPLASNVQLPQTVPTNNSPASNENCKSTSTRADKSTETSLTSDKNITSCESLDDQIYNFLESGLHKFQERNKEIFKYMNKKISSNMEKKVPDEIISKVVVDDEIDSFLKSPVSMENSVEKQSPKDHTLSKSPHSVSDKSHGDQKDSQKKVSPNRSSEDNELFPKKERIDKKCLQIRERSFSPKRSREKSFSPRRYQEHFSNVKRYSRDKRISRNYEHSRETKIDRQRDRSRDIRNSRIHYESRRKRDKSHDQYKSESSSTTEILFTRRPTTEYSQTRGRLRLRGRTSSISPERLQKKLRLNSVKKCSRDSSVSSSDEEQVRVIRKIYRKHKQFPRSEIMAMSPISDGSLSDDSSFVENKYQKDSRSFRGKSFSMSPELCPSEPKKILETFEEEKLSIHSDHKLHRRDDRFRYDLRHKLKKMKYQHENSKYSKEFLYEKAKKNRIERQIVEDKNPRPEVDKAQRNSKKLADLEKYFAIKNKFQNFKKSQNASNSSVEPRPENEANIDKDEAEDIKKSMEDIFEYFENNLKFMFDIDEEVDKGSKTKDNEKEINLTTDVTETNLKKTNNLRNLARKDDGTPDSQVSDDLEEGEIVDEDDISDLRHRLNSKKRELSFLMGKTDSDYHFKPSVIKDSSLSTLHGNESEPQKTDTCEIYSHVNQESRHSLASKLRGNELELQKSKNLIYNHGNNDTSKSNEICLVSEEENNDQDQIDDFQSSIMCDRFCSTPQESLSSEDIELLPTNITENTNALSNPPGEVTSDNFDKEQLLADLGDIFDYVENYLSSDDEETIFADTEVENNSRSDEEKTIFPDTEVENNSRSDEEEMAKEENIFTDSDEENRLIIDEGDAQNEKEKLSDTNSSENQINNGEQMLNCNLVDNATETEKQPKTLLVQNQDFIPEGGSKKNCTLLKMNLKNIASSEYRKEKYENKKISTDYKSSQNRKPTSKSDTSVSIKNEPSKSFINKKSSDFLSVTKKHENKKESAINEVHEKENQKCCEKSSLKKEKYIKKKRTKREYLRTEKNTNENGDWINKEQTSCSNEKLKLSDRNDICTETKFSNSKNEHKYTKRVYKENKKDMSSENEDHTDKHVSSDRNSDAFEKELLNTCKRDRDTEMIKDVQVKKTNSCTSSKSVKAKKSFNDSSKLLSSKNYINLSQESELSSIEIFMKSIKKEFIKENSENNLKSSNTQNDKKEIEPISPLKLNEFTVGKPKRCSKKLNNTQVDSKSDKNRMDQICSINNFFFTKTSSNIHLMKEENKTLASNQSSSCENFRKKKCDFIDEMISKDLNNTKKLNIVNNKRKRSFENEQHLCEIQIDQANNITNSPKEYLCDSKEYNNYEHEIFEKSKTKSHEEIHRSKRLTTNLKDEEKEIHKVKNQRESLNLSTGQNKNQLEILEECVNQNKNLNVNDLELNLTKTKKPKTSQLNIMSTKNSKNLVLNLGETKTQELGSRKYQVKEQSTLRIQLDSNKCTKTLAKSEINTSINSCLIKDQSTIRTESENIECTKSKSKTELDKPMNSQRGQKQSSINTQLEMSKCTEMLSEAKLETPKNPYEVKKQQPVINAQLKNTMCLKPITEIDFNDTRDSLKVEEQPKTINPLVESCNYVKTVFKHGSGNKTSSDKNFEITKDFFSDCFKNEYLLKHQKVQEQFNTKEVSEYVDKKINSEVQNEEDSCFFNLKKDGCTIQSNNVLKKTQTMSFKAKNNLERSDPAEVPLLNIDELNVERICSINTEVIDDTTEVSVLFNSNISKSDNNTSIISENILAEANASNTPVESLNKKSCPQRSLMPADKVLPEATAVNVELFDILSEKFKSNKTLKRNIRDSNIEGKRSIISTSPTKAMRKKEYKFFKSRNSEDCAMSHRECLRSKYSAEEWSQKNLKYKIKRNSRKQVKAKRLNLKVLASSNLITKLSKLNEEDEYQLTPDKDVESIEISKKTFSSKRLFHKRRKTQSTALNGVIKSQKQSSSDSIDNQKSSGNQCNVTSKITSQTKSKCNDDQFLLKCTPKRCRTEEPSSKEIDEDVSLLKRIRLPNDCGPSTIRVKKRNIQNQSFHKISHSSNETGENISLSKRIGFSNDKEKKTQEVSNERNSMNKQQSSRKRNTSNNQTGENILLCKTIDLSNDCDQNTIEGILKRNTRNRQESSVKSINQTGGKKILCQTINFCDNPNQSKLAQTNKRNKSNNTTHNSTTTHEPRTTRSSTRRNCN